MSLLFEREDKHALKRLTVHEDFGHICFVLVFTCVVGKNKTKQKTKSKKTKTKTKQKKQIPPIWAQWLTTSPLQGAVYQVWDPPCISVDFTKEFDDVATLLIWRYVLDSSVFLDICWWNTYFFIFCILHGSHVARTIAHDYLRLIVNRFLVISRIWIATDLPCDPPRAVQHHTTSRTFPPPVFGRETNRLGTKLLGYVRTCTKNVKTSDFISYHAGKKYLNYVNWGNQNKCRLPKTLNDL